MTNLESSGGTSDVCDSPLCNFAFAFNNSNFSDKILRIEILDDEGYAFSIAEGPTNHKRPRLELNGDEADNNSLNELTSTNVKTLHICSPILAAMSPFFYKLFSNGMMESEQRQVTLRINESEEVSLMELLNFMYSKTLSTITTSELLNILIAADKYEVASCTKYCCRLLLSMEMTPEAALMYLELPCSILMDKVVQPLKDAARKFLAVNFDYLVRSQGKVVKMCMAGFEAVLSSDNLKVSTENVIYIMVLQWARHNYPNLKERQEIIGTRLIHLIRFPYMTFSLLKNVLNNKDLDHKNSSRAVLEALLFKLAALHQQRAFVAEVLTSKSNCFVARAYIHRPVKVVEFDSPRQQCVVYLDMKREECANLLPPACVYSQVFHLGGQGFFLQVNCNVNEETSLHTMGLYLGVTKVVPASCEIYSKFAARKKPIDEYVIIREGKYDFTCTTSLGYRNLFGMSWTDFIAEDSLFFINDMLCLRVEVTIKN